LLAEPLVLACQPLQFLRLAPLRHASDGTPITREVQDPLNCYIVCPVSATDTITWSPSCASVLSRNNLGSSAAAMA
jgi:hypothetical protein